MAKKVGKGSAETTTKNLVQLSVRIPHALHKHLKLKSLEADQPLRIFLVEIIAKAINWSA